MSGYVTPETIFTLTLLDLWCSGHTSPKATNSILLFIVSQINANTLLQPQPEDQVAPSSSQTSLDLLQLEELLSDPVHIRPDAASVRFATYAWESFVLRILRLNNLDAVVQFFNGLTRLFDGNITPQNLVPAYPAGAFVRRQILEFEKLQFSDQMKLWRDFEAYRSPLTERYNDMAVTDETLQEVDTLSNGKLLELVDNAFKGVHSNANSMSSEVATKLLEFQVERMQKFGTRLPKDLRDKLELDMEASSLSSTLTHYVRFLDAWYAGDYPSSFESLHRYYDYALQSKDRSHYQYALLNMAMLHADFGCHREAMAAIAEAIAAARENKDMACLTFCLSWLYQFRAMNADKNATTLEQSMLGSEVFALNNLIGEARKHELWGIESSAKLSEAALCLAKGHRPREAFERIYETAYLKVRHNIKDTIAAQLLLQSSTFGRLGLTNISKAYCDLIAQCYSDSVSSEDFVRSVCRSAQILCQAGRFDEGFTMLETARKHSQELKPQQYLVQFTWMLKLQRCLLANDLPAAELLLAALNPTSSSTSKDLTFHIQCLEIDYLMRLGSFSEAYERIELLNSALNVRLATADIYEHIRLLVLKAKLFIEAGRPEKGFIIAVRACMAAHRSYNAVLLWEAVGVLAKILCALRCFETARDILLAVFYQARESDDAGLCASLAATLAEAAVGLASLQEHDPKTIDTKLQDALEWAQVAHAEFSRFGDVRGVADMDDKRQLLRKVLGENPAQRSKDDGNVAE